MHTRKSHIVSSSIIITLVIIVLVGVGLMVYPIVAAKYSESVRSEIQTSYEEVMKKVDTRVIDAMWEAAQAYNADLASKVFTPLEYEEHGYFDLLILPETEVMCYVSIPKIDTYLPVYHSVSTASLDKGAGHMEQSSLPVGGIDSHAVISAHSGMAQSPMFSDLELLEIGDIFQIHVLNQVLTYEVDNIEVVLPQYVDSTMIQPGEDLVSLITCTPYGINTHRLIVRGHRIENPIEEVAVETTVAPQEKEDTQSVWMEQYWKSLKTGSLIALTLLLIFLVALAVSILYRTLRVRGKYERK